MNKYYKELRRAIKPIMKKHGSSKDVKMFFFDTQYDGEEVTSLVIEGIDNKYSNEIEGEKVENNWEIYLFPDGTWKIV